MPFHHVTAGLLYKGNYLNRSLSAGSDSEQLANISVEELDGECCPRFPWLWGWGRLLCTFSVHSMRFYRGDSRWEGRWEVGWLSRSGTPRRSLAEVVLGAAE